MKPKNPARTTPRARSTETRMSLEQRDARRLHIDAQHLLGIAPGEKYIGADDLGGVIRAHAQQRGGLPPQAKISAINDEQHQAPRNPPQYFHGATS